MSRLTARPRIRTTVTAVGVGLLVFVTTIMGCSEAIDEYSSAAEADRWVATADTSAHVTGDAVDIGPAEAAGWLSVHGAAYGLCRVYGNEPWHFELRPDAAASGCPPVYADPSADPRVH